MKIRLFILSLLTLLLTMPVKAENNGLNKKTVSESNYVLLLNSRSNGDNILLTYSNPEMMFITVTNPSDPSVSLNYNIDLPVPTVEKNKISIVGISTNKEAVLLDIYIYIYMLESKAIRCDLKISNDLQELIYNNTYNMECLGFAKTYSQFLSGKPKYDTNNTKGFSFLKDWMKKFTMYTSK